MKLREILYLYAHLLLASAQVLRGVVLDLLMTKLTLCPERDQRCCNQTSTRGASQL